MLGNIGVYDSRDAQAKEEQARSCPTSRDKMHQVHPHSETERQLGNQNWITSGKGVSENNHLLYDLDQQERDLQHHHF